MTEPNVHSIDVSGPYQPRDVGPLVRAYQAQHVVVHVLMPNEGPGPQWSRDQINSSRDAGATVGIYVMPYSSTASVDYYLQNTLEVCASVNLQAPCAWLDCEPSVYGPGPDETWMDRWLALCDGVQMPSGIYCNRDWFKTHPGFHKYGPQGRPLWLANWDGIADVTQGWMPIGWTELAGKQWAVSDDGLGEIDRDVFREEYTIYASAPPDPCQQMRDQLAAWRDARPYRAPSRKKIAALLGGS